MSLLKLFLENNRSVATDTRKIKTGDIYFALKGANFNGNNFAIDALEKGASFAIVDEDITPKHKNIIKVENVLSALQHLATEYRRFLKIPVLAITGSNGKTTTKELLATVLKNKYNLNYTEGNLNNDIGVPLTILKTNIENDFLLVEMGANHQGEINQLCEIAEPNFGLITNIGKAHLEGFGGEEGVKIGKSEMYRYLHRSEGKVFINMSDNKLQSLIPENTIKIEYDASDFNIIESNTFLNVQIGRSSIKTKLTGEYNIFNIAAAFSIGKYFGIEENKIIKSIEEYSPQNNRSQLINKDGLEIILDAYNANPSSTESSLKSFLLNDSENKIVILGDMFELGEYANQEHKRIIELTLTLNPYKSIFIGNEFYNFSKDYPAIFYKTTEEAKMTIDMTEFKNFKILVKGSRGMALEKLLND